MYREKIVFGEGKERDVIHIRGFKGRPLCRFTRLGQAHLWPKKHGWTPQLMLELATCTTCRKQAVETGLAQKVNWRKGLRNP